MRCGLEGEAGNLLGASSVKWVDSSPIFFFFSSIGASFLPVYFLLFTWILRECFRLALSSLTWIEISVFPLSGVFAWKPHLSLWNKSYFFPLWGVSGLIEQEELTSLLPFYPGKCLSHPLKSHLLGNCLQCYRDKPELPLNFQGQAKWCLAGMSLKDTCLRNPLNCGQNQPFH